MSEYLRQSERMTRRKFIKGTTGAVLGLSALSRFNVRGADSVKLGVVWPLGEHPAGLEMQSAAQYAADMVNSQKPFAYPELIPGWEGIPNLGGRKLELLFADHNFDPDQGAMKVRELKSKGAIGILGCLSSEVTYKASEAAAEEGLPMISAGAFLSSLTKRDMDSYFRICSDTVQGAKSLFAALSNFMDDLSEDEKAMVPTNYVYVIVEYPRVEEDIRWIKRFAEEGIEGEFPGRFTLEPLIIDREMTLGDIIAELDSMNLGYDDAIIPVLPSNQVIFLVQDLVQKAPVVEERPGLVFVDPFLSTLQGVTQGLSPDEMRGWRWTLSNVQFFNGVFQADADFASDYIGPFRDDFVQKVGTTNPLNSLGFTGVHTWAAALNMAGSTRASDLIQAVNELQLVDIMVTNWNGINFGKTQFGDSGANIDAIPGTAHLDEHGNLEIVELPGGFTPSSAYANINILTNYSCLMNCISIGIEANMTQLQSITETTTTNHSNYSWDSHDITTDTTVSTEVETSTNAEAGTCFLTTACVEARKLPDDCHELTTLRDFRDEFVRGLRQGDQIIQEYYEIAPKIINKIDGLKRSSEVYEELYRKLVQRSVELIELGRKREAFENYRSIVQELKRRYL
ncbi:MAG: ABC transporter substrate-binding protein [Candidatus Acetothermia bacterium]